MHLKLSSCPYMLTNFENRFYTEQINRLLKFFHFIQRPMTADQAFIVEIAWGGAVMLIVFVVMKNLTTGACAHKLRDFLTLLPKLFEALN